MNNEMDVMVAQIHVMMVDIGIYVLSEIMETFNLTSEEMDEEVLNVTFSDIVGSAEDYNQLTLNFNTVLMYLAIAKKLDIYGKQTRYDC